MSQVEPTTYKEAISYSKTKELMVAMNKEMESFQKNQTWRFSWATLSSGCKWVFKKKFGASTEEVVCNNVRLVAKGSS